MIIECLKLFYAFFKIGVMGFGGGYAMMSMIITESAQFSVSVQQMADLNALDMVVPGPIAINAATYVGYLHQGFFGALFATLGVSMPSFILITIVLKFLNSYRENKLMNGVLSGVKPAAVGLIVAAALTIASGALLPGGVTFMEVIQNPFQTISLWAVLIFVGAAVANIVFKVNTILLTAIAGILGAFFL